VPGTPGSNGVMGFFSNRFRKAGKKAGPETVTGDRLEIWSGDIAKDILLKQCPFVVFDTELSGLDPRKDFIVSVGAIKMTGSTIHISREFYRLVKPAGEVKKKSVEIHGITPAELENQEGIEAILPDFFHFIRDSVLVGHFVHIDIKFMNRVIKQHRRKKLVNPAVDTHSIHEWLCENSEQFRKHYRGVSGKTDLFSVAQQYGIPISTAHDALNDSFVTAQLFQRFLYFLQEEGVRTLDELLDIGKA
jgi:DNA polymerase-3 subunit epsilon